MSKRYTPAFGPDQASGVRVLAQPGGEKSIWSDGTVPVDGKAGYEKSAIHQRKATHGVFINEGTVDSCDFNRVVTSSDDVALAATVLELNRIADRDNRVIVHTTSTLTVTEALHNDKIIVLDLAAGIAVTLPAAAAGLRFRFIVKTTFTGAASIKSVTGADIMIGHALMGNNSDNTVVDFPAVAASTLDTIDLFGTANSTGGIEGQEIEIIGLGTNLWFVSIRGDAAGTEATPFANTVA